MKKRMNAEIVRTLVLVEWTRATVNTVNTVGVVGTYLDMHPVL